MSSTELKAEYWIDLAGNYRCVVTKNRLTEQDLAPGAKRVPPPPGERERSDTKPARKKRIPKQTALGVMAHKPWPAVSVGDLVRHKSIAIWRVAKLRQRILFPEDLWNYPHLVRKGLSAGDEIPPLLSLKLVLDAELNPADIREPLVDVDASDIVVVTPDWLSTVIDRLASLGKDNADVQKG